MVVFIQVYHGKHLKKTSFLRISLNFSLHLYSTLTAATVREVFSKIFPAMTGIMEGANLSGDLENPGICVVYPSIHE